MTEGIETTRKMSNYFNRRLIQFLVAIFVLINRTQATDKKNQVVEDRNTGVLEFIVQTCTSLCNCQPVTLGLVVDNNWRGVYYNLCYDPKQCDMVILLFLKFRNEINLLYMNFIPIFRFQLSMIIKLYLD